jgi:GNAT superfamily N-acetyltransferase
MSLPTTAPLIATRRAMPGDASVVASLAEATFVDTFGADNTPENMAEYLSATFGEALQRAELEDSRYVVFFAEAAGEIVGYVQLREVPAPAAIGDDSSIEIVRLYSVKGRIGTGVGAALMQRALDEAAARAKRTIWLGVWEHNPRAQAFYRRWGFREAGSQIFVLGKDRQRDLLMSRAVQA